MVSILIFLDLFKEKAGTLSTGSQFSTGTITLEHDLYQAAAGVAPSMIDQILSTNVVPMPVSECVGGVSPYKDASLVIPPSRKYYKSPQPYVSSTPTTGSATKTNSEFDSTTPSFIAGILSLLLNFVF